MQRIYSVSLTKNFFSETVILPQYDENYQLVFRFVNNEYKSSFDGKSAYFEGTRNDGLSFRYSTVVSGNTATFVIDRALTAINGEHKGQIVLYDNTGLRFGSSNVKILVEKAARPDNAIDADVTSQQTLLEQIQEIVDTAAETTTASTRQIVSDLTDELSSISTASATDVGKYLRVRTVEDGKVTGWEFGETGSPDDDDPRPLLGNTPLTLTEDANIELESSVQTSYEYGPAITADFSQREDVRLNNVTLTEVDGNYEIEVTEGATAFSEAYARMYFGGFTAGVEYSITVYPVVNDGEQVSGGTYGIFDAEGNLIKYFQTANAEQTETFVATETTMRFRIYPAGVYAWDRGYRKARISDIIIQPSAEASVVADFSDRTEVVLNNATLNEGDGYFELSASDGAESYTDAYATMVFNGLTVGKDYIIYVTPQGDSANLISGGYYVFTNFDGNNIGDLILLTESDSIEFTATTDSIRLRLYVGTAYFWQNNYRKARLSKLTITQKTSGSFRGVLRLGVISAGTEIRSTPTCRVYQIKEETEEQGKTRHAGKTCVCFGDSVTGFLSPPYDYPSVIAKETGMTVYNVGFAGCRMSDTHPYPAYKRFGMVPIVDAIVSGDWSEQDAYVDQIESGTFPQAHLANLKAIDWAAVDFVTIFYGGNDAGNGVPIGDPTGKNIQTYLGAFNYAMEKLITAYPNIKFLILTPIFRYWPSEAQDSDAYDIPEYGTENVRKYYEWGDALIERAKVYKVPYVDMYRTLGINAFNRATYLKNDGAHPKEIGAELIGCKISARLLSEY